ncbi:MAG: hypothetical protein ACK559_02830 [bacterium]
MRAGDRYGAFQVPRCAEPEAPGARLEGPTRRLRPGWFPVTRVRSALRPSMRGRGARERPGRAR